MLDDLGSYSLSDFLLFSRETYFGLFELHNEAWWPLHLVAAALGVAAVYGVLGDGPGRIARGRRVRVVGPRAAMAALALLWAWTAWAFHLERYATVNLAAPYFAALFFLEAGLLGLAAAIGPRSASGAGWKRSPEVTGAPGAGTDDALAQGREAGGVSDAGYAGMGPGGVSSAWYAGAGPVRMAGLGFFGYALLAHPLLELAAGRSWSQLSWFGMAPDPTAIGTIGVLMLWRGGSRGVLLVIPILWCALAAMTGYGLAAPEWIAPAVAPIVAVAVLSWANYRASSAPR